MSSQVGDVVIPGEPLADILTEGKKTVLGDGLRLVQISLKTQQIKKFHFDL